MEGLMMLCMVTVSISFMLFMAAILFQMTTQVQVVQSQRTISSLKVHPHTYYDNQRFWKIPVKSAGTVVAAMQNRGFELDWFQESEGGRFYNMLFRRIRRGEMNVA